MFDQSGIFSDAKGIGCFVMRLDNLKFSDIVKECCEGVKNCLSISLINND